MELRGFTQDADQRLVLVGTNFDCPRMWLVNNLYKVNLYHKYVPLYRSINIGFQEAFLVRRIEVRRAESISPPYLQTKNRFKADNYTPVYSAVPQRSLCFPVMVSMVKSASYFPPMFVHELLSDGFSSPRDVAPEKGQKRGE